MGIASSSNLKRALRKFKLPSARNVPRARTNSWHFPLSNPRHHFFFRAKLGRIVHHHQQRRLTAHTNLTARPVTIHPAYLKKLPVPADLFAVYVSKTKLAPRQLSPPTLLCCIDFRIHHARALVSVASFLVYPGMPFPCRAVCVFCSFRFLMQALSLKVRSFCCVFLRF